MKERAACLYWRTRLRLVLNCTGERVKLRLAMRRNLRRLRLEHYPKLLRFGAEVAWYSVTCAFWFAVWWIVIKYDYLRGDDDAS